MANAPPSDAKRSAPTPLLRLKVRRQDGPDKPESVRWEEFDVPYDPDTSVAAALQQVERDCVSATGERVAPIAFDASCLEEVCGSCAMRINGKVQNACSASIGEVSPKGKAVTLEPLSKFPVVRDLIVDRSAMVRSLTRVQAWAESEGMTRQPPRNRTPGENDEVYRLTRCTSCAACLEACPEFKKGGSFIGAFALNQAQRFNLDTQNPTERERRLNSVMRRGGIADCGKAQNCVEVCPVDVPLVDSLQGLSRATSKHLLFDWLLK